MLAFEELALRGFEDETVEHLKDFASRHSKVIGEAGVRQVIRLGISRAKGYGFTNCGPVRFYIEMMFLFGSDFDTDPLLPWAAQELGTAAYSEQLARAMGLYHALNVYIDRVIGRDRAPFTRALRRAYEARLELLTAISGHDSEERVFSTLAQIFPERLAHLGEEPLRAFVRRGPDMAERIGLATGRGVALSILLAYALGHGFASDPLCPWVENTLRDPNLKTPEIRVERLERRAGIYLEHALRYLEEAHDNG
ncbi:hypothetical protein [Sorangium cellulosum]|nr:hypothetical protein [Sorangium cellulosum]